FRAHVAGEERNGLEPIVAHPGRVALGGPLDRRRRAHVRLTTLPRERGEVVEHALWVVELEAEGAPSCEVVIDDRLQHGDTSANQGRRNVCISGVGVLGGFGEGGGASVDNQGCATCVSSRSSTRA